MQRRALVRALMVLAGLIAVLPSSEAAAAPVITAAGDIARENEPGRAQRRTARLVREIDPRMALTLGDNQYPDGALADYLSSYDPTWGRFLEITRPVPGNHEYHIAGADGYFDYFGRRARRGRGGYYSYDVGAWHLVAVNSGRRLPIAHAQLAWVRRDLRRDRSRCDLAYWHHPRWSSSAVHGSNALLDPLWRLLVREGVDVVLNGHAHNYERFTRMTATGDRTAHRGVSQFVVGTGGAPTYRFGDPVPGSRVRITRVHGVLKMTLYPRAYEWAFVRVDGEVLDHGRTRCHR